MDEREKLPVIIGHWIEHNQSHIADYRKWGNTAGSLGLTRVQAKIEDAIEELSQSNQRLEEALEALEPS
jgi:hypothetical protein